MEEAFVPLCTCTDDDFHSIRLHDNAREILESDKYSREKFALVGVLDGGGDCFASTDTDLVDERGLYISSSPIQVQRQGSFAFVCTLRNVDLQTEPFWGSLLLALSSHVIVVSGSPMETRHFQALSCISHFLEAIQPVKNPENDQEMHLLKALMPKLTWAAIDLKIKHMNGSESPTKYFESVLENIDSAYTPEEELKALEAQMMVGEWLPTRDCIIVKSSSLRPCAGFSESAQLPWTSSKVLGHVQEHIDTKAFYGRFMNGSMFASLCHALATCISQDEEKWNLQLLVEQVQMQCWKALLQEAYARYCNVMHARIEVYERMEVDAQYLVDMTERKLEKTGQTSDARQSKFSAFDEFGNLVKKTEPMPSPTSSTSSITSDTSLNNTPLNTGIFKYLKTRAEKAFQSRFSTFPSANQKTVLNGTPEDMPSEVEEDTAPTDLNLVLQQVNAPIKEYTVPDAFSDMKSEKMPFDTNKLDALHDEAVGEMNKPLSSFVTGLNCTRMPLAELASRLDFSIGKKNLMKRIKHVQERFEVANKTASAFFCGELLRYLHSVVVAKTETDKLSKQENAHSRVSRGMSVIQIDTNSKEPVAPLTRVPFELLTYKNNLEAMVSQYHFIAKGPMSSRLLLEFFDGPVRKRLESLSEKEYDRFAYVMEMKEDKVHELEETLEGKKNDMKAMSKRDGVYAEQQQEALAQLRATYSEKFNEVQVQIEEIHRRMEQAMQERNTFNASTVQAMRQTKDTRERVVDRNRVFQGYLERYEGRAFLMTKRWRQYYFVLDHGTLKCYRSKSAFEEREKPAARPIQLTGYRVEKSRTDEMKMKLVPPEAGEMLRFRAPASVGRDVWLQRMEEATQMNGR